MAPNMRGPEEHGSIQAILAALPPEHPAGLA